MVLNSQQVIPTWYIAVTCCFCFAPDDGLVCLKACPVSGFNLCHERVCCAQNLFGNGNGNAIFCSFVCDFPQHPRVTSSWFVVFLNPAGCLGPSSLRPAAMSGKSLLLKVILLGDGGVGKSSLMNRYVTNKFDSQAFHTIGVEFLNRDLEVDGRFVTLQIWDTAGQERFKSLRTPFYRGADCCLLTFSVDDRQSFENLSNWQKEFVYYADVKDPERFPFVVLGNKIDKLERQVSTEEAQAWCMENGNYPYLETSAKDDTNVAVAFEEAVRQVLAVEEQLEHCMLGHTIDLHSSSKSGSSCC